MNHYWHVEHCRKILPIKNKNLKTWLLYGVHHFLPSPALLILKEQIISRKEEKTFNT